MPTREEVRDALDGNFKKLMDCLGQLTEEELTTRQAAGEWTAKDVIAHVWARADEAGQWAKAWRKPRSAQEGSAGDDARNLAQVEAKRILPLITVVDGITGAHRRLMHQLDMAEDAALQEVGLTPGGAEVTLLDYINEVSTHYAEHARALAEFQECCLNADGSGEDTTGA
jgi:hypothetical protein